MTNYNFSLVKKSWAIVAKIDFEIVGGAFYIRLFQVSPELKQLFKTNSMTTQSVKLGCMLSYFISKFEQFDDILVEVKSLAERHTKYGVKEEYYKAAGNALLWTLEQGLGEYWNEELNNAWMDFYETLSTVMIKAQKDSS